MLFESFIANELLRINKQKRLGLNFFHYRDHNQSEIDLILQRNPYTPPIAIEIKSGTKPDISARHIIRNFKELVPEARTFVVCNTDKAYREDALEFLPFREAFRIIFDNCP